MNWDKLTIALLFLVVAFYTSLAATIARREGFPVWAVLLFLSTLLFVFCTVLNTVLFFQPH